MVSVRRTLIVAGVVAAFGIAVDAGRRGLWLASTGREAAWGDWILITAFLFVPWVLYSAALATAIRRYPALTGSDRWAWIGHGTSLATLIAVHPLLIACGYWLADVPGARSAPLSLLYADVFLGYAGIDLAVGLLAAGALLAAVFRQRYRTAARLVEDSDDRPQAAHRDAFAFRDRNGIRRVPVGDVAWIGAAGNYVELNTATDTHLVRGNLGQIARELDPVLFLRVHRSAVVNVAHLTGLVRHGSGWAAALGDDRRVPVGRRRLAQVRSALERR